MLIPVSFPFVRHYRSSFPIFVPFLLLLMLLLAACGGTTTPPKATSGGNISVGLNSDVVTLNPLKSSALVDRQVMLNIYDTLVKISPQNTILPDLATSWF